MIRILLLLLSLSGLAYSAQQLLGYWDYQTKVVNIQQLLYTKASPEVLSERIGMAINEDRLEDAKGYLAVGKRYHYPLHYDYYYQHIQQRDTQLRKLKKGLTSFSAGFMTGKATDASGITGAITSDFTVVGDARDLYEQYQNHHKGQPVSSLIVGLAGVGIGLTAVTYGTAGTTAVAKAGTSTLKLAAKTGRLTKQFSAELVRVSAKVFDWKLFQKSLKQSNKLSDYPKIARASFHPSALAPLQRMAKQVDNVRINTSLSDTLHLLRYVESGDDLRRLEKFTLKHQQLSKSILKITGKAALGSVRVLRKTTGLLLSFLGTVISGLFSLLFLFSRK